MKLVLQIALCVALPAVLAMIFCTGNCATSVAERSVARRSSAPTLSEPHELAATAPAR